MTNCGTGETTGTVTSSLLAEPLTVIVPAGETVIVQVVWTALLADINDFLFTVTAASIQIEVLP